MNIENELIESLSNPNTKDIASGLLEIGIDQLLDNGLLKEIPIVSTLSKSYDLVSSIRDRIFIQKLIAFLLSADTITDEDKFRFYNSIGKTKDDKIGEKILFAIEKVESIEKSMMIGRLFKSLVLGLITREEFDKSVFAITQIFLGDFKHLTTHPKDLQLVNPPVTNRLYQYELFEMPLEVIDENGSDLNGKKYVLSPLGVKFVNSVFTKNIKYKEYSRIEIYKLLEIK